VTREPRQPPTEEAAAKQRILAAAEAEFGAKGLFGARTQAIADAAGINKAMLHYYFQTKENLYEQVIRTAFKRVIVQAGQAWLAQGPMTIRVERVIDALMDTYSRNPNLLRIILREVVDGGERLRRSLGGMEPEEFTEVGRHPREILAQVAAGLGVNLEEALHLIQNLVGMCLISFIGPPVVASVFQYDLSDFQAYLGNRRKAIKALIVSFVRTRLSDLGKE